MSGPLHTCALPAPLIAPVAGRRPPPVVIGSVAAVLPSPVRTSASLPPIQGTMPLAPPVTVIPVPVIIVVLEPLRGPPLTGSLWEWVWREVPKMRATAIISTG